MAQAMGKHVSVQPLKGAKDAAVPSSKITALISAVGAPPWLNGNSSFIVSPAAMPPKPGFV
jgi:hypothetical protein